MRVYTKKVDSCRDCPSSEWGHGGKWCMEGAGILTEGEGPLPDCPLPMERVEVPLRFLLTPVVCGVVLIIICVSVLYSTFGG